MLGYPHWHLIDISDDEYLNSSALGLIDPVYYFSTRVDSCGSLTKVRFNLRWDVVVVTGESFSDFSDFHALALERRNSLHSARPSIEEKGIEMPRQ